MDGQKLERCKSLKVIFVLTFAGFVFFRRKLLKFFFFAFLLFTQHLSFKATRSLYEIQEVRVREKFKKRIRDLLLS